MPVKYKDRQKAGFPIVTDNLIITSQICAYSTQNVIINAVSSAVWEYRLFSALSSCTMVEASEREEGKGVNLHVVETEREGQNFHKSFHGNL